MMIVRSRDDLPDDRRLIALTFDDGPSEQTPLILDLLRDHRGRATFFVLGESVEGREEILARTLAEGHEVGNHTYGHVHPDMLPDGELAHDIARCQRMLGGAPCLFRPPYGEDALRASRIAAERGLPITALWSVTTLDWEERSPQPIVDRIMAGLRPGAIVDLHDGWPAHHRGHRDRLPTVAAVAQVLPQLASQGYRCVTLSELLSA